MTGNIPLSYKGKTGFLKVCSLNREPDQERLSLKGGSSLVPLRQGRSYTAQLHQTGDKLGGNRVAIGE